MAQQIDFTPKEQETKIDFTPKSVQIDFTPKSESKQEESSFLTSMYEKAFTPSEFMSRGYDWLREHPEIARNISPLAAIEIPWGGETYKPGLAMAEAMSTPGDLALILGTGGAGWIPKIGRGLQK
jgi:hypothetical protein